MEKDLAKLRSEALQIMTSINNTKRQIDLITSMGSSLGVPEDLINSDVAQQIKTTISMMFGTFVQRPLVTGGNISGLL